MYHWHWIYLGRTLVEFAQLEMREDVKLVLGQIKLSREVVSKAGLFLLFSLWCAVCLGSDFQFA